MFGDGDDSEEFVENGEVEAGGREDSHESGKAENGEKSDKSGAVKRLSRLLLMKVMKNSYFYPKDVILKETIKRSMKVK